MFFLVSLEDLTPGEIYCDNDPSFELPPTMQN